MISATEELLILKSLVKMYEESIRKDDLWLAYQVSVDLSESAQKLSDLALDVAKKHGN